MPAWHSPSLSSSSLRQLSGGSSPLAGACASSEADAYVTDRHWQAALRAGHDGAEIVPALQVSMNDRRPAPARVVAVPPVHQCQDRRIELQPFVGQTILIAHGPAPIRHLGEY